MSGLLALVGGDEFRPGNEPQDRLLAENAGSGKAFVVPTAAARQRPELAVEHARRWFARLGLELAELPVFTRSDAASERLALEAENGGFFYLCGGDPGLVASTLRETRVWAAILQSWRLGAVLAGSSAGAMALCQWTLIRKKWPNRTVRTYRDALAVVPQAAVLPHFNAFGERWIESALSEAPDSSITLIGLDERTAAVWDGVRWRAIGAGRVIAIKDGRRIEAMGGDPVPLPEPAATG